MKKLLISFLFILGLGLHSTLSAKNMNNSSPFPEFSKAMDLGVLCRADCTFTSCSGSGSCSCSCNWFKCTCSKEGEEEEQLAVVSMNETQYKKTKLLANILSESKNENAIQAYSSLVNMVTNLKSKNYLQFQSERAIYLKNIFNVDVETKEKLNLLFEVIGAKERV
ncbi:hypothetical protein Q73A0000_05775 [Kaistella flava (ex Peng et al. 2021)]|uniref:Uncharacterized protein n=1 Tax=Kaistella flava (ex Peng et al. 2021) TaxID=2038776 RepID=A0A7M2Y920_9FLAO|nr:hypothetical protein [Kaistella flava (ex Peng et al. 2021)]QOW09902.1 hypothetical protein Q73A0000_05775 [Kaistella flava (ex Peng et al. 2021)]